MSNHFVPASLLSSQRPTARYAHTAPTCTVCLRNHVVRQHRRLDNSEDAVEVVYPVEDCNEALDEREIYEWSSKEDFERFMAKSCFFDDGEEKRIRRS
jgi:hypothetical protein